MPTCFCTRIRGTWYMIQPGENYDCVLYCVIRRPKWYTRYNTYQGYIFTSHLLSSAFISLSFLLIVVTQILCHIYSRLSSRLPTLRFVPFFFIAGKLQPSLPGSSTRVELRLRALGALSSSVYPLLFLRIDSKSHRGAIRTQGPTLAASEGNRTTGATYAPGLCIRM